MGNKKTAEQIISEDRERLKRLAFVHSGANEIIRRNPKTRRIFDWLYDQGYLDEYGRWIGYRLAMRVFFLTTEDAKWVGHAKQYRAEVEAVASHLMEAARLLRLPDAYFFDKLPEDHPFENRLSGISSALGVDDKDWFGNKSIGEIISLMGKRGKGRDPQSGYRGAVVLLLDSMLPLELPGRNSAIAELMRSAGIETTRQAVKVILDNDKSRRNPPKYIS